MKKGVICMFDFDDIFNKTVKKTQQLLEDDGVALSLKEIKKLSTINLTGYRNEGERLLRTELAEKYGETTLRESLGYQVLYPFIDEGVIKTTTRRDETFFTHFYVTEKRDDDFDMTIQEYDLYNGYFYCRYLIMLEGLPIKKHGESINCKNIRQGCMKEFIFDRCSKERLHHYYNSLEYSIVKKFAEQEAESSESQAMVIINQVISTFSSINFLLERDQKATDAISKSMHHTNIIKDLDEKRKTERKIISLGDDVKIKMALPKESAEDISEKVIKRHTGAWMVSGHLRHYKSGKVIFVAPYPKGPERNNINPANKEYVFPQESND